MAILGALQSAALRLVSRRPTAFFSVSTGMEAELVDLANEVARDIAGEHDWRALTTLATLEGYDGVAFDMPADYDRLPKDIRIWSPSWPGLYYEVARDLNAWYDLQQFSSTGSPGWWILLGDGLSIYPAVATGSNVQFYYQSKNVARSAAGAAQAEFTSDTDTFRLSERLLTLGIIWRWRSWKGLEYAEDLANYQKVLAELIGKDRGSQVHREGRRRMPRGVSVAYPGVLG